MNITAIDKENDPRHSGRGTAAQSDGIPAPAIGRSTAAKLERIFDEAKKAREGGGWHAEARSRAAADARAGPRRARPGKPRAARSGGHARLHVGSVVFLDGRGLRAGALADRHPGQHEDARRRARRSAVREVPHDCLQKGVLRALPSGDDRAHHLADHEAIERAPPEGRGRVRAGRTARGPAEPVLHHACRQAAWRSFESHCVARIGGGCGRLRARLHGGQPLPGGGGVPRRDRDPDRAAVDRRAAEGAAPGDLVGRPRRDLVPLGHDGQRQDLGAPRHRGRELRPLRAGTASRSCARPSAPSTIRRCAAHGGRRAMVSSTQRRSQARSARSTTS